MKKLIFLALGLVIAFTFSACGSNSNDMTNSTGSAEQSSPNREVVKLPENYDEGVLYTTVTRGNAKEYLYTSRETIEAVKKGEPMPSGTVFTLEIYRDGELSDIFVSEKRTGWNDQTSSDESNGDWRYQAYTADRELNNERDLARCISCHATEERDDFVYTYDEVKDFELEDFTASKDNATESQLDSIALADWEVAVITDYLANLSSD
ncbi:cytochrome P460 family protein [Cohnella sp.]|uniref:cytochrome P460 family protein n=1 Tax=Cohnella sp. TaxID=1883426 RepID=UPI00356655A8